MDSMSAFFFSTQSIAVFRRGDSDQPILRFLASRDNPTTAGLWDRGHLARFLDFSVSLPLQVKSRPTLWGRTGFEKDSLGKSSGF